MKDAEEVKNISTRTTEAPNEINTLRGMRTGTNTVREGSKVPEAERTPIEMKGKTNTRISKEELQPTSTSPNVTQNTAKGLPRRTIPIPKCRGITQA